MARTRKLDLIQEPTTHKSDYKPWPMPRHDAPRPAKRAEAIKPTRQARQIDYQSHLEYTKYVPFDLYMDMKPIVGTDPRQPIPAMEKQRSTAQSDHFSFKLPGRYRMDITDEDIIRGLIIATYHPVHRDMMRDACQNVQTPSKLPNSVVINDEIRFIPDLYPPLPPGWVEAARHWDSLQSRAVGDPTRMFWLKKGAEVECFSKSDYHDLLPEETKREIRKLIEEDKLRLPFTITKTGYSGYRPRAGKGVSMARKDDFNF